MLANAEPLSVDKIGAPLRETTALEAWKIYRKEFYDTPSNFVTLAESLLSSSKHQDALEVLTHAIKLYPEHLHMAALQADIYFKNKDYLEAGKLYARMRQIFPEEAIGYVYGGCALWAAEKFDEADQVLSKGIEKFPKEPWAAIHYAWSARHRKNWPEAAERYSYVRSKFPEQPTGYIEGGWTLREAGKAAEADEILRLAVEKFPQNQNAWFHYGRNASSLANWQEAVKRWEECRKLFPKDSFWQRELQEALYASKLALVDDADSGNEGTNFNKHAFESRYKAISELTDTDIIMRFESIGDNCEFGLTQRYFGAEPIGLMRFGEIFRFEDIVEGLRTRFEGVGLPENTTGDIYFNGEYLVRSKKVISVMHTGIFQTADIDLDGVVQQMLPRLRYMARRIVEGLENTSKIWVYKQFDPITDEEIEILYRALRDYGDNRLLCIRRPDSRGNEGDVLLFNDRVAIGYIEYFKMPHENGSTPRWDVWRNICKSTLALLS